LLKLTLRLINFSVFDSLTVAPPPLPPPNEFTLPVRSRCDRLEAVEVLDVVEVTEPARSIERRVEEEVEEAAARDVRDVVERGGARDFEREIVERFLSVRFDGVEREQERVELEEEAGSPAVPREEEDDFREGAIRRLEEDFEPEPDEERRTGLEVEEIEFDRLRPSLASLENRLLEWVEDEVGSRICFARGFVRREVIVGRNSGEAVMSVWEVESAEEDL
jgi:hypothetical protein